MAQQPGYPPQGYGAPYGQGDQQAYGTATPPPQQAEVPAAGAAGKKKRQYAGQAYDFGVGANNQSQLGAVPPSGLRPGPYDAYGQQAGGAQGHQYGIEHSAPQQAPGTQPVYGQQPAYGQQAPGVGGYQSPNAGYAPPDPSAQITQGMGQMNMGDDKHRPPMNVLYPTDLMSHPFQVSELDAPPPPLLIPPNVGC
jgi:protein transport protein SEC24